MPKLKPSLVTQTKLDNDSSTDVTVNLKRTVTYIVNARNSESLSLPYAVSVNGKTRDEFKSKPKRVSGKDGRIVIRNIDPGSEVGLFLNSDAHPDYRKSRVYVVVPKDRDIVVKIDEKPGRHLETDVPVKEGATSSCDENVDTYLAVLTGDIWMKVSHKYSSSEVDGLLPSDVNPVVAAAVKKIYDGLETASLNIPVPRVINNDQARNLLITFDDGDNPRSNISSGYDFINEGLKRVHPAGYAAIFSAAVDSGVEKIGMTSAWRPMLGSIAHRAGLGLDINYVGRTRMNREKLRKNEAIDAANVSREERRLFADFESSKTRQIDARKAITSAELEVKRAEGESGKLILAKQKLKEAIEASANADKDRKDAEVKWSDERDKHEPDHVRRFRSSLVKSKSVAQIFDPWFMDTDTHDSVRASPNMQKDGNEKLHAHHLHITVYEPKIL